MQLLKAYLKDHRRTIAAVLILSAAAGFLFYLYSLPLNAVLYTGAVTAVLGLAFFAVPDFIFYCRRVKTLEGLRKNLLDLLDFPSLPASLPETVLQNSIQDMCGKIRELETEYTVKREGMLEYYTLWVHQIKTPLAAMRLILQSDPHETSGALLQELFKVERYVEMVLGYLRLDTMSADLRLEKCAVHSIVSQAVKKFAPQFIYRKLSLRFQDFDARVITDEKWLLFALEQIFSNALKYTPEGGTITVSMDEGDVLTIGDTGIGISPEDLPRVFERGFTGLNGRQEKTSTGLGLYLTKQVLDRLRTPVEIVSQPGKGTQVKLYLHRDTLSIF